MEQLTNTADVRICAQAPPAPLAGCLHLSDEHEANSSSALPLPTLQALPSKGFHEKVRLLLHRVPSGLAQQVNAHFDKCVLLLLIACLWCPTGGRAGGPLCAALAENGQAEVLVFSP